jgi:hypothetical protein
MKKRDPDLDPLPVWKQYRAQMVAWWKRSRDQRRTALQNAKKAGRRALTLAISMVGATLISYGVWSVHHPAGYAVAGLLVWAIQWNYGNEEGDGS